MADAKPKTTTVIATNKTIGPRLLHGTAGGVSIPAGAVSEPTEMHDHELEIARGTGWFEIAEQGAPAKAAEPTK